MRKTEILIITPDRHPLRENYQYDVSGSNGYCYVRKSHSIIIELLQSY